MVKTVVIAVFALVVSFFATTAVVHGQTATPTTSVSTTPTMTPSPTTSQSVRGATTVPNGAPATGHGE